MKSNIRNSEEIDELMASIHQPRKVEVPSDFKNKLEQNIQIAENKKSPRQEYLKWAAIWLIVFCNFGAYYSYLKSDSVSEEILDEADSIELLVEEYYQEETLYEQALN